MKKRCFLVLCLCVIHAGPGRTAESEKPQSELLSSRGWYVLRQFNAGPLLLGLTQRLGKVIESSQRDDVIWNGIEQGGSLNLNIVVEGDVTGEIFIGFFKDPHWSSEPDQVRSFPGPGDYLVENLPDGKFQIGAMIGSPPAANALGVQQNWPEPVEIEKGKTHSVKVLVSRDFQLRASGWYNKTVSKDFIGDWEDIDTDNPLQGRVTGPGGQAVAFAMVQIREYKPGARSIKAPNRGTNENGCYKCDGISWPYTVGVLRYKLLPSTLGCCHQFLFYNRVFEKCETVDFQFENYPVGNATVGGHVLDDKGSPLKKFFVDIRTKMDWEARKNPDGKFYSMTGYRVPCLSEDGSYEVDSLPEGDVTIRVIPFNNRMYEMHRGQDIRLQAGKATIMNLKVVSKNVLYGRVLFRDGSPAVVKPTPWPGATTSILLPMGMGRARGVAEVDDEGYFALYLSDREVETLESGSGWLIINVPTSEERRRKSMGDFPFEKLSADKDKAGILKIGRPNIKPLVSVGKPLPVFEGIDIEFDTGQVKDRMILVCFFDMDQRPSQNCMMQLANQADRLKEKGISIVAIHAAKVERTQLDEWIRENEVAFPVGMIPEQEEQVRFDWGAKSLPWLILTNKQHIVTAEGFVKNELDNKIQSAQ
ncbi:MAG TPA: hypothetical protein DIU00_23680 [Phycisphaerales bacterium]|nr:hypothetical protein [Phycisphaerales bacterium]